MVKEICLAGIIVKGLKENEVVELAHQIPLYPFFLSLRTCYIIHSVAYQLWKIVLRKCNIV